MVLIYGEPEKMARFDNIMPTDPCDIVLLICHYIDYKSDMRKSKTKKVLR
jgi:hypothetical protein